MYKYWTKFFKVNSWLLNTLDLDDELENIPRNLMNFKCDL